MPLKVRLPMIAVGIAVLTWMMRGGATVVVDAVVGVIRPVNRQVERSLDRAGAARPDATAWVTALLERIEHHFAEGELLHGLEVIVYDESIVVPDLDGGRVQTGPFLHGGRAFVDVAYLGILDTFARPDPNLSKSYLLARLLARYTAPDATGADFERAAGSLGKELGLIPPSWRAPARIPGFAHWLSAVDSMRTPSVPRGWTNHLAASPLPLPEACSAFAEGLAAGQ